MIALMIIGAVLITVAWGASAFSEKNDDLWIIPYFLLVVGMALLFSGTSAHFEKKGQIKALKGKQSYEIQVVYRDTTPVDTLYVKIK